MSEEIKTNIDKSEEISEEIKNNEPEIVEEKTKKCRFCGRILSEGFDFCTYCGKSQSENSVPIIPKRPEYSNIPPKAVKKKKKTNAKSVILLVLSCVSFAIALLSIIFAFLNMLSAEVSTQQTPFGSIFGNSDNSYLISAFLNVTGWFFNGLIFTVSGFGTMILRKLYK